MKGRGRKKGVVGGDKEGAEEGRRKGVVGGKREGEKEGIGGEGGEREW